MEKLISFFHTVGRLKTTKRAGWLNYRIKDSESVADHSYRAAVVAMIFGKRMRLNEAKLFQMILLHDLAEAVTGDIIVERGDRVIYPRVKKLQRERKAMEKILSSLQPQERKVLLRVWLEFEEGKTREARIARQLDKLEMAMQAFEYERENPKQRLDEFFIVAKKYVQDKQLQKLLEELLSKR